MRRKYDTWRIVCEKCGREAQHKAPVALTDAMFQNAESMKEAEMNSVGGVPYDMSVPCPCGGRWCTVFADAEKPGESHAERH